jgi:integrase
MEMNGKRKNGTNDIYNLDHRIELVHKIMEREFSKENYSLIKQYDNHMIVQSLAKATREIHVKRLLNLTRMISKNWCDVTKQDIDEVVSKIMLQYADERGKETNSSYDHKKVLKMFFRWYKIGTRDFKAGDPPETKEVKLKKVGTKVSREDLITEVDLKALLESCKLSKYPSRDRAFIECQAEASTRPGELLSLKIKHVKFDECGAIIHVDGKTGTRTIRLVPASTSLSQWIAVHPFGNNPESPLWIQDNSSQAMTYDAAYRMVRRRVRDAQVSKRIFMTLFRHTGATEAAQYMTEAQMRKRHGWSQDSKMPGRYVHLINADVDRAVLKRYGLVKEEENVENKLPKKCLRCTSVNTWDSVTCARCQMPFDLESSLDLEQKKKQETERITAIEKMLSELLEIVTNKKASKQQIHKYKIIQKTLKDNPRLLS